MQGMIDRSSLMRRVAISCLTFFILTVTILPQPKVKAWVGFLPVGFEIAMMAFEVLAGAANKTEAEPITTDVKAQETLQDSIITSFALTYTMVDQVSKRARIAAGLESGTSTYTLADFKGQFNALSSQVSVSLLKRSDGSYEAVEGQNYYVTYPTSYSKDFYIMPYSGKSLWLNGIEVGTIWVWPHTWSPNEYNGKGALMVNPIGGPSFVIPSAIKVPRPEGLDNAAERLQAVAWWTNEYTKLPATDFKIVNATTYDPSRMRDADYGMEEQMITVPPVTSFKAKVRATGEQLNYDWNKGTYTKASTGQAYTPAADGSDIKWVAPPVVKQTVNGETKVGTTVTTSTGQTKFVDVTKPDTAVPPLDIPLTLSDFAISLPAGRTRLEIAPGKSSVIPVVTVPAAVGIGGIGWTWDDSDGIIDISPDGVITGIAEGTTTVVIGDKSGVLSKTQTLTVAVTVEAAGGMEPPGGNDKINWDKLIMAAGLFTTKFPFSVPWDVKRQLDVFNVTPTTPVIDVNVEKFVVIEKWVMPLKFKIDFGMFDGLAAVARWFLTIAFDLAIILGLRRFLPE